MGQYLCNYSYLSTIPDSRYDTVDLIGLPLETARNYCSRKNRGVVYDNTWTVAWIWPQTVDGVAAITTTNKYLENLASNECVLLVNLQHGVIVTIENVVTSVVDSDVE